MKPNRIEYPRRLSVQITDAMDDRLEQVARGRDEAKSEVVRAALRAFLDEQEDLIGSRKHFTKAFGRRIDHLERILSVATGGQSEHAAPAVGAAAKAAHPD